MLVGLMFGFTRRARGNLAKICIILNATGLPSNVTHSVFSSFCSSLAFHSSRNTKREARDFSARKRQKNTAGGRASGKNARGVGEGESDLNLHSVKARF